jgi:hypothetical protein
MKYLYERKKNESEFTIPVKSEIEVKGNKSIYNLKAELNQENPLTFNNIMLSVNELTCSNIEILLYEMNVAENDDKEINDELIDKENREMKYPIESKGTYFMKIPKTTSTIHPNLKSKTLKVTKKFEEEFLILLPNWEIGYSRISLYNILSEKTMFLHFQMSRQFLQDMWQIRQTNNHLPQQP